MVEVLHAADEVKRAIRRIFSEPRRRRVAIVAFVGNGATDYLPKPKGIELYCWPHPGGTSSKAIRGLLERGVKVAFADRVHMKVYWSAGGCLWRVGASLDLKRAHNPKVAGSNLPVLRQVKG